MTDTNTSAVSSVIDAGSLFRGLPSSVEIYEGGPREGLQNEANLISGETKKKMIEWWGDSIWEYYAATAGGGRDGAGRAGDGDWAAGRASKPAHGYLSDECS